MRRLWELVTSHYLCVYTGLAFVAGGLLLSLRLNWDGAYFERIDHGILLEWVVSKLPPPVTLSSVAFIIILLLTAVLFLNSLFCTLRKVYHLVKGRGRWRKYLPHFMHLAFLIVVAGHLISSTSGNRVRSIPVFERNYSPIRGTPYYLKLNGMDVTMSDRGYPSEFSADITLFEGTKKMAGGTVSVNHPLVHGGYGIYIKNAGVDRLGRRYVLFDANRDDGAVIVLIGAVIFTMANLIYLLSPKGERGKQ